MRRAIVIGLILLYGLFQLIVSRIPGANDRFVSSQIYKEFAAASTNMITGKQLKIAFLPRRGATRLFVYGDLSANEEATMKLLAVQISQNNSNRPISLEFRKEVQPGTNN